MPSHGHYPPHFEPEPLHRYGRLRTSDPAEAEHVVAQAFEPHRLRPRGHERLDARMNAVQTGDVTIGYLTYGQAASISLPANDRWYHVNVTLKGSSRAARADGTTASTEGRRSAAVLLPQQHQTIEWEKDTEQLAFRVPRSTLEGHLATMLGRTPAGPLELGLRLDLTGSSGQSLLRALEFTTSEWDAEGMLTRSAPARRHLEQLILSSFLLAAEGPHHLLLTSSPAKDGRDVVQIAKDYIHEFAHQLPTLNDLLRVTGVSARTLQARFRDEEGCGPMHYLRQIRLREAHAALRHPQGPETTVTDVAVQWGFLHLGRFASQYRESFGESPSQTLQRALARS